MKQGKLLKKFLWVSCRAWLVTGLCVLFVGLGFGIYTSIFLFHSMATKGTIVNLVPQRDEENDSTNYAPVFAFAAVDGKTYTVESGVATNPPGFELGQVVQILYEKSNPAGAKLASFWQLWFVTVLCSSIGVFFSVAGYFLLCYERRCNRLSLPDAN
jgi:hypothetical protein